MRSVHIGCSRYSRRCHLKAPSRTIKDGAGASPRAQSPKLDIWVWRIEAFCLNYVATGLRFPAL
jgi:hypothetical protein